MTFHSQAIHPQSRFSAFLLKLMLGCVRPKASAGDNSQQGLTLIEGLIAIVIIALTVIMITPPVFWATATRVQNQRAEQALKIAQGEIDRVRAIVERDTKAMRLEQLPPTAGTEAVVRNAASVAAPNAAANTLVSASAACNADNGAAPANPRQYIRVDVNSDCTPDFLVQTFRSEGLNDRGERFVPGNAQGRPLSGFVMGVRVYSIAAKDKLDAGEGKVEPAQLRGTTGLGFQRERPLAVTYSTIVRSTSGDNLGVYRKLCETSGAC